jgi:hypothetical protein
MHGTEEKENVIHITYHDGEIEERHGWMGWMGWMDGWMDHQSINQSASIQ